MSYTPSPVTSHKKEEGEDVPQHATIPAPQPPQPEEHQLHIDDDNQKGLWKYVPFQYMSLKPKIRNPYVTTVIACMGGLLFGFGSTNLTPFIGQKYYEDYFTNSKGWGFTAIDQSGMTASIPGGALIGSIISACIAEHVGRRGMVEFSSIIWTIGAAIQTSCINRESLAFGRIISGTAIGMASSNVPMYLAEMVPARTRGRFVSCFQFSVNVGILVMFYIGLGCSFIHGIKGFRLAQGIQMVPGAIMFVGSMFLNESPRWLASKGKWDEVEHIVAAINKCDVEDQVVQDEVNTFKRELEVTNGSFLDLFRKKNVKQSFCAGYVMFTQQYCGCNAILYFSTSITSQVGYHGTMNKIMGSIDYIVLLAATLPSLVLFDRWSRRHNLILGAFGLLTSLAIVAGIEATRGEAVGPEGVNGDPSVRWNVPEKPPAKAALAFSYIFLGIFSLSWGPGGWVYVGEVFNQDVRSVGNGYASVVNWLFNFTLTIYTQTSFEHITWKTYVIFAVFIFISMPIIFLFFPETRGYELEQISAIFDSDLFAYKTDPLYVYIMEKVFKKEVKLPAKTVKEKEEAMHSDDSIEVV